MHLEYTHIFRMPDMDIDFNYIGTVKREKMLQERPKIEESVQVVFNREEFTPSRAFIKERSQL
jgi:hypothetical protein